MLCYIILYLFFVFFFSNKMNLAVVLMMQKSNVPSHVHDSGIVTDGRTFDIAGPEGLLLRGRGFFLKPKCL